MMALSYIIPQNLISFCDILRLFLCLLMSVREVPYPGSKAKRSILLAENEHPESKNAPNSDGFIPEAGCAHPVRRTLLSRG